LTQPPLVSCCAANQRWLRHRCAAACGFLSGGLGRAPFPFPVGKARETRNTPFFCVNVWSRFS